jgi:hypothetical protein
MREKVFAQIVISAVLFCAALLAIAIFTPKG